MLYSVEANLYNTFESEIDRCHRSSHPKGTGVVFGGSGIRFKKGIRWKRYFLKRYSVEVVSMISGIRWKWKAVFGRNGIQWKWYSVEAERETYQSVGLELLAVDLVAETEPAAARGHDGLHLVEDHAAKPRHAGSDAVDDLEQVETHRLLHADDVFGQFQQRLVFDVADQLAHGQFHFQHVKVVRMQHRLVFGQKVLARLDRAALQVHQLLADVVDQLADRGRRTHGAARAAHPVVFLLVVETFFFKFSSN